MIPAGTYAAVVVPIHTQSGPVSCQFGESGVKRTPLVSMRLEILRGPFAGQSLTYYGYFPEGNEEAAERTIRALRACGFKSDNFGDMPTEKVNQECQIVVVHEEFEGKVRAKILWINAVSTGLKVENQMDKSKLRLFSSRFEKKLKSVGIISGPEAKRDDAPPADYGDQGSPTDDGDPGPVDDGERDTRGSDSDIPF